VVQEKYRMRIGREERATMEATTPHLKVKHSVLECIDSMARFCHAMMIKRPLTHHPILCKAFPLPASENPLGYPY
jgi:hypothetical protein